MPLKILTSLPKILAGLVGKNRAAKHYDVETLSSRQVHLPRLGVFIDFENVNAAAIPLVIKHLSPRWNPAWRRAYGTGLAKHSILLHANGILPIEVMQNTRRKNSADIALVIDLMLAACSDSVDAFCILSSDGDFTRLALILREQGKPVLIAGRATTPLSLRSACTEFIDLDDLLSTSARGPIGRSGSSNEPQSPNDLHHHSKGEASVGTASAMRVDAAELLPLIRELTGDHGTTTLSAIQIRCSRRYAAFSPKMCGATKWRPLLQTLGVLTVEPIRSKGGRIQDYAVGFLPAAPVQEVFAE